ncbi:hypothetical protein CON65_19680 [Bacillus pseudomycoides]|uniref:Uncharacterized protein n=1 Tax=Bacillus pseudomycoides TaxID=64104 RepID=A0AA91V9C8_9BACI|nr:hypothetical protein COO03_10320 [Bacillus sp. AFS098217]PED80983.1 hypothetical protein CON65_19680 [Bacillus pseudomycoides]PEU12195.1 hypothetical protein CN524_13480 [Bacillus sp. AFS019443]PEU12423.1 hypothetical protein CN525_20925 [Bacillus sp. AFS014408]PFW60565.1 hypothetical protein COL20_21460 [Bacillus sp. AFS075034]
MLHQKNTPFFIGLEIEKRLFHFLLFRVSFAICNPTFDGKKDVGLDVCIGVFFCYNVRMHKRKFKKSGQDNLRISSLLCQSGTHVV